MVAFCVYKNMEKIKIQDNSGDKNYFTIIPNYILNHSTIWDREVYIQMKRITGEEGTCWTSQKKLSKQCGISINRLKKSIKYLLENKWIEKIGTKQVETIGGIQEVNEYKIIDLWKLNSDFYNEKHNKGVSPENTPITKGVSRKSQRGITDEAKGVSPEGYKEELYINKNPLNNTIAISNEIAGIPQVINLFKDIDLAYIDWFKNTTQRNAAEKLLIRAPINKLEELIITILPVLNSMPYNPRDCKAFNPFELNKNWAKIMAKIKEKSIETKQRSEKSKMTILR